MPSVKLWTGARWAYDVPVSNITLVDLDDDDTDQTASLQAQINAVDDGVDAEDEQIIRLPDGRYRIDGTPTVSIRNWLTIESVPGGRFTSYTDVLSTQNRSHWNITGGSTNIKLRHLDVEGYNIVRQPEAPLFGQYLESYYGQHGVAVQGACDSVTVEDMNISYVGGDFLYCGGTGDQCTNVTMRNITGRYAGRQAMGIVNVDGFLGEDLDLQWNGRSGLDIEPNHDSHYVKNLTLRRCTIGSRFFPYIIGGDAGDLLMHVEDILLEDCVGVNSSSSHSAILSSSLCNSVIVRRHTDLRQRSTQAMVFSHVTDTVVVEDCNIMSGVSTPTSYGLALGGTDFTAAVTITGSSFQGTTGPTSGADELYLVGVGATPASITHCGNTWAGGTLNDGAC